MNFDRESARSRWATISCCIASKGMMSSFSGLCEAVGTWMRSFAAATIRRTKHVFRWDGTQYLELDRREVRKRGYDYLEDAVYLQ